MTAIMKKIEELVQKEILEKENLLTQKEKEIIDLKELIKSHEVEHQKRIKHIDNLTTRLESLKEGYENMLPGLIPQNIDEQSKLELISEHFRNKTWFELNDFFTK